MATFDFQIDNSMVGQSVGPPDGFLVSLRLTTTPPVYETPSGDDGSGLWRRGYFQIRGSRDYRDLFCGSPSSWGYFSSDLVANRSLAYRGNLTILCVPKSSVFSLTLSDQPYVPPPPPPWPLAIFNKQRDLEPVRR